jgi:hypothetical protein
MTSSKILVAATLLSVMAGTTVSARTSYRQHSYEHMLPRFDRVAGPLGSWCLHNYADDNVDCSYSSRSQCAATASGGLGECSMN